MRMIVASATSMNVETEETKDVINAGRAKALLKQDMASSWMVTRMRMPSYARRVKVRTSGREPPYKHTLIFHNMQNSKADTRLILKTRKRTHLALFVENYINGGFSSGDREK